MKHDGLRTVSDLIDLWGALTPDRSRQATANFGREFGIPVSSVRCMRWRNSIARKHWPAILESARKHALDPECSPSFELVTAQLLVDIMSSGTTAPRGDSISVCSRVTEVTEESKRVLQHYRA